MGENLSKDLKEGKKVSYAGSQGKSIGGRRKSWLTGPTRRVNLVGLRNSRGTRVGGIEGGKRSAAGEEGGSWWRGGTEKSLGGYSGLVTSL